MSAKELHKVTEKKSSSENTTQNNMVLAWKLILDQYFQHVKKIAMEEGAGISLFCFLRTSKKNGSNCTYYYSGKNDAMWDTLINLSPDGKEIAAKYDSNSMVCICVQVPKGTTTRRDSPSSGFNTIGNIKLFSIDTGKEVNINTDVEKIITETEKLHLTDQILYRRNVRTGDG